MKTKIEKIIEFIKYQFKLLKHRPRLIWNSLYIRKDEFDKSLDLDIESMKDMNNKDRGQYLINLSKRREIAHYREIEKDLKDLKNCNKN
jgi:hypothetical protein